MEQRLLTLGTTLSVVVVITKGVRAELELGSAKHFLILAFYLFKNRFQETQKMEQNKQNKDFESSTNTGLSNVSRFRVST